MLSGTWFLPISLQRQKQIKPSGYSAALKFKVCHCGSLHLKLPGLNIFVLLTHPCLNRELSELAGVPDSPCNYVQIRVSWIYSPAKAAHSHLSPTKAVHPLQGNRNGFVNLSPASGLTYLADTHQTGALTPTHTLTTFPSNSSEDIVVKVKFSTKQMLIITEFPQTVLSYLIL